MGLWERATGLWEREAMCGLWGRGDEAWGPRGKRGTGELERGVPGGAAGPPGDGNPWGPGVRGPPAVRGGDEGP